MNNLRTIARRLRASRNISAMRRIRWKRRIVEASATENDYKVDYQPGEEAEFGYNEYREYPKDFKPWKFNVSTNFMVFGAVGFLWMMYFMYERTYLESTGRVTRDQGKKYFRT